MRVTNSMLNSNFLFNVGRRQEEQATLQDQISSGKKFVRPSQDPLHIGRSLTLRNSIGLNNRLNENIQQASSLANVQDDNLSQVNDVLQRIRELAVQSANSDLSSQQFDAIAREVEQMTDQIVTIGNYSNGEKFLFGGHQTALPPFDARHDIVLNGVDLNAMGLNALSGTQVPVVQRIPARPIAAGAFAMPDGSLSINGYDLGAINLPDPTRTSAANAQSLVERIATLTSKTGVRGVVVNQGGGNFAVQLEAKDALGNPTGKDIAVAGTDLGRFTGIYNGATNKNQVQVFGAGQVTAGADINAGDLIINGTNIGFVDLTTGAPPPNQIAQRLVDAINAKVSLTGVTASTNTNGTLILSDLGDSIDLQTTAAGNAITRLPLGASMTSHVTGTPVPAGPLSFNAGSLSIDGVDIFPQSLVINNPTPKGNADVIASYINGKANDTGVRAKVDAAGKLYLSSVATVLTAVNYVGDSGKVNTEAGVNDRVATNIPGDVAFAGSRAIVTVAGMQDVPGVPVSLAVGQLVINGVDVTGGFVTTPAANTAAQNATALVTQINNFAAQTGIIASVAANNPQRLVLTSRGATIDVQTGAPGLNPLPQTGISVGKTQVKNTIFQALLNFRQNLVNVKQNGGIVDSISLQSLNEVGDSLENLTNIRSVLGAQANRLEKSGARLDALNVTDQSLLSQNEDTEYTNALTQLSQEETVYRAALGVGSRILPPSLMDFMR